MVEKREADHAQRREEPKDGGGDGYPGEVEGSKTDQDQESELKSSVNCNCELQRDLVSTMLGLHPGGKHGQRS